MVKEKNARDYALVEIYKVQLISRETYILLQFLQNNSQANFWKVIVFEQKNQLYKKLPSCSIIRDIVDGIEYKKFKQNGGFLTNEDHLTLLFNTDGIPLYKSSKVNIGPVFLAINELPLEVQFAKKYNSLGTLAREGNAKIFNILQSVY